MYEHTLCLLDDSSCVCLYLQQCRDGECRNAAVAIGDESLKVHVAGGHHGGVEGGDAGEGLDGCIAERGLG